MLVLERKDVASGSAGATDGVVGYHTKKPGKQMTLDRVLIAMFRDLGRDLGEEIEYGFQAGGMQPVEDKMQWDILSEIVEQQRKSGVDIRMISTEEARRIEPQLSPDIYGALYSPTGGKVNPLKLTMAYAHAAKRLGARIQTETEVTGFIREDGAVKGVETNKGPFRADVVVDACGAWAGKVAALLGLELPIKPRKGQLAVTEPVGPFMKATLQCARYNVIKFRPDAVTDPAVKRLGSSLSIEQTHAGGMIIGGTREFADYEEENTFEALRSCSSGRRGSSRRSKMCRLSAFSRASVRLLPTGCRFWARCAGCQASTWPPDTRATALRFRPSQASWWPSRSSLAKAHIISTLSAPIAFSKSGNLGNNLEKTRKIS